MFIINYFLPPINLHVNHRNQEHIIKSGQELVVLTLRQPASDRQRPYVVLHGISNTSQIWDMPATLSGILNIRHSLWLHYMYNVLYFRFMLIQHAWYLQWEILWLFWVVQEKNIVYVKGKCIWNRHSHF